ncbi:hypothetical protein BJ138DRAFT_1160881 [Hygrophoropsis aurantiaca]|uniref:Uncharacterized protein n=1 Tax=Hygrophoropsis aurantiaca TaxID=72124 RepID=A0ACB8A1C4_9AGAM|nr:hypothetical protein BJ138DRAFT_1160881 [Hygrophoropsis aurantiaca]
MNQTGLSTPPLQQPMASSSASATSTMVPPTIPNLNDPPHGSLDSIVLTITSATNLVHLNTSLRNFGIRDGREGTLSKLLADGQDPLDVLDIKTNTLGLLYILSARLHTSTSERPSDNYIKAFCREFSVDQARYAPDRVTLLARGIAQTPDGNQKSAVQPLFDLLTRYAPTLSYLTTIHSIFITACVSSRYFSAALPVLCHPITIIDTNLSELHYNDNLIYHYAGGLAFAALKRWSEAEEMFEICAASPGQAPAAIQLEALKKMILVQLIHHGKTLPPPKYIHSALPRLLKGTPYTTFMNSYPQQRDQLRAIVEKEQQFFAAEKNLGLISQALERAPRWSIKKLTATYLTLHLSDIGQAIGIEDINAIRALVLSMIETSEISAQLSADGTVAFSDPPLTFEKADVDKALLHAQEQGALLARLEKELARNKEYLTKAVKSKDDTAWGQPMDEDSVFPDRASGPWADEAF